MRRKFIAMTLPIMALGATSAFGQTTVYNNMGSDTSGYFINGATENYGDDVTNTDFELLNLAPETGLNYFNNVDLDLYNSGSYGVVTNAIIGVWDDTGTGGGPGNEMFTINSNLYIGAYSTTTLGFDDLYTVYGVKVAVPTDNDVWMSITFTDDGGTDGTTAAELDELSPAVGGYPSIGSTDQEDYFAGSPGDIGTGDTFYGSDPTVNLWGTGYNFGANITTAPGVASTPGPAALIGFVAPALVALRRRLRR